jgi:hypothetical protein
MDGQVRDELGRAIQREGVSLSENPQRVKALLMDACPEAHMEINLLVAGAEDEIPARLARASESVFRDSEITRSISDLRRNRRLDDDAASWVVRSWASVLGLGAPPPDDGSQVAGPAMPPSFGRGGASNQGPGAPSAGFSAGAPWREMAGTGSAASVASQGAGPPMAGRAVSTMQHPAPWPPAGSSGLWNSAPAGMGPIGSVSGGPPPSFPQQPGVDAAPPPRPRRGRLFAIVGAVVLVLAVVVGAVVFAVSPVDGKPTPTPLPTGTSASPSPGASPETATVTIVDTLLDIEVAETATVYSFGKEVGVLQINQSNPTATLTLSCEAGTADYQVNITMMLKNGKQISLNGAGTIPVFDGARYVVQITGPDASDNFGAALKAIPGGSGNGVST